VCSSHATRQMQICWEWEQVTQAPCTFYIHSKLAISASGIRHPASRITHHGAFRLSIS
jgi:hypothetical protein